jgi:hypothetical protein
MGKRSSLFIDWLAQTIKISSHEHTEVKHRLDAMVIEERILPPAAGKYSELTKSYRHAYRIPFGDGCFCIIQIAPYKTSHRFMRIEWNPATALRVCTNPFQRINDCLRECIPSYSFDEHIWDSKITRIDLTFDLRSVALDSFLIHTILRKPFSGRYYYPHEEHDQRGKLNEIHIGKPDGDKFLTIYDKELERKFRKNFCNEDLIVHSPTFHRGSRVKTSQTRFELRLGPIASFEEFRTMQNPFSAYSLTGFEYLGGIALNHHWHFFTDSCKQRGAQAALSLIENDRDRKKYADALKGGTPGWWNDDEIWSERDDALDRVFAASEVPIYEHDWFHPGTNSDSFVPRQYRPRHPREAHP